MTEGAAGGGDDRAPRVPAGAYAVGLTVVIVLTAAMLRSPFVAVAPVAGDISADLEITAGVVGLLTSIPVLCFAVFAPLAIVVIRRAGPDFALTLTLGGSVLGCIIRSLGGVEAAIIGTAVMGVFLTIGNVVIPVIIGRDFSRARAHTMTGVYTSSLNIGTMIVTLTTAPLADVVGWRTAIVAWAGFGLAALAVWIPLRGVRASFTPRAHSRPADGGGDPSVVRNRGTWLLAAAFAGQAFAFYSTTAWLPTLLVGEGLSPAAAGAVAAIFQVAGIAGSMTLPLVTVRASIAVGAAAAGIAWLAVPVGFLVAPQLWLLWCLVGGVAQGGGITVVFIMISAFGGDAHTAATRSGIVQGVGYAVAAAGPILLGAMHEATGAWTIPLLAILAAVVLFLVCGALTAQVLRRTVAHAAGDAGPSPEG
ncbi:MFS transporter [Microbacter sp. GSS18]|nr:MFS transporter [Microbacter sp. GSS18]